MNRMTQGVGNFGAINAGSAIIGGMSFPLTAGKVYYVKGGNGSDSNSGRSWSKAFATVAQAMTKVADYDVIMVRGAISGANHGRIVESVTPSATNLARYVQIVGVGPMGEAVGWKGAAATTPCLTLNYKGWKVSNFYFEAPTGAAAIKANRTQTASVDASDFVVENCTFHTGAAGIQLSGAPHNWRVRNCLFRSITGTIASMPFVNSGAIICTDTTNSVPLAALIENCDFLDNVISIAVPMIDGRIRQCYVQQQGNSITASRNVDLRNVDGSSNNNARNFVAQNVFGGTFSKAGFYWASGSGDQWFDNNISSGKTSALPA